MAGMAGFEPTNARVKVWCLTAWRHPNVDTAPFGRTHGVLYHALSRLAILFLRILRFPTCFLPGWPPRGIGAWHHSPYLPERRPAGQYTPRFFPCNLSNRVICCPWCCQQRPGRRFPSIFSGVMLLLPPIERTGVAGMDVTWEGIFQFCMLIAAVIALVLQANNKKR